MKIYNVISSQTPLEVHFNCFGRRARSEDAAIHASDATDRKTFPPPDHFSTRKNIVRFTAITSVVVKITQRLIHPKTTKINTNNVIRITLMCFLY